MVYKDCLRNLARFWLVWIFIFQFNSVNSLAEETFCAKVKIEILQELTLERQGFEATMRITNGLDTFSLEDVAVDILFQDEDESPVVASSDPNASSADFFIRLDGTENISGLAQLEKGRIAGDSVEADGKTMLELTL